MSEPDVDWYLQRNQELLEEIDKLISSPTLTNSIREIILHNTNEIQINFHIIVRKLRDETRPPTGSYKAG